MMALGEVRRSEIDRGGSQMGQIMKRPDVEIAFVLDKSGSMGSHSKEAIDGFNGFLRNQSTVDGKASMTLAVFSDNVEVQYQGKMLEDVVPLNKRTYDPDGMTALHNAVGITLREAMTRHTKNPNERPARCLMVILTDGDENASKEFQQATVKAMVQRARSVFGWEFILLGVGIRLAEVKDIAVKLGIEDQLALPVSAGGNGVLDAYKVAMDAAKQFREEGTITRLLPPRR